MRIIAGSLKGKRLPSPVKGTRPTSDRAREMLFNILEHNTHIKDLYGDLKSTCVLDVFAGSGALGFEALSRGASTLSLIENNFDALTHLKTFISSLPPSVPAPSLFSYTVPRLLRASFSFNLIFLDPPYGQDLLLPALKGLKEMGWIAAKACLILEMGQGESLTLPSPFALQDTKTCGRSQFWFVACEC